MGSVVCVIGLYANGLSVSEETGSASWTCRSNSEAANQPIEQSYRIM